MGRDRAQPEIRPLRLFIAVDVPSGVKSGLAGAVAPYRARIPGVRWTGSQGWHATLKFLGTTWPRLVEDIRRAVEEAARSSASFETRLTQVGAFPSARRARVLWAGLADPEERFAPMVKLLDELLEENFVAEKRSFTPHLTLARLNPSRDIGEFAPDLDGLDVGSEPFPVDRLVLYQSHLSPRGATYEAVASCPMG